MNNFKLCKCKECQGLEMFYLFIFFFAEGIIVLTTVQMILSLYLFPTVICAILSILQTT